MARRAGRQVHANVGWAERGGYLATKDLQVMAMNGARRFLPD